MVAKEGYKRHIQSKGPASRPRMINEKVEKDCGDVMRPTSGLAVDSWIQNSAYGQYQCHTFFATTTIMLAAKEDEYFCRDAKYKGFSTSNNMTLGSNRSSDYEIHNGGRT
jgi:hypothetical protein